MDNFILNNTDVEITEKEILISKTNRGRKVNLFVSGWEIEVNDLKNHLKNLKKSLGCNGSVKTENIEGTDQTVLHLQGDHTFKVEEYIKKNVDSTYNIKIK